MKVEFIAHLWLTNLFMFILHCTLHGGIASFPEQGEPRNEVPVEHVLLSYPEEGAQLGRRIVATINMLWWYSKGKNCGCKLHGLLYGLSHNRCIGFRLSRSHLHTVKIGSDLTPKILSQLQSGFIQVQMVAHLPLPGFFQCSFEEIWGHLL